MWNSDCLGDRSSYRNNGFGFSRMDSLQGDLDPGVYRERGHVVMDMNEDAHLEAAYEERYEFLDEAVEVDGEEDWWDLDEWDE